MAAMAPPRVARGSTPCRGSILMLDYGARSDGIRRGRMSARGSRVDSRGFGPRPLACRASVLPVHTTSPVTSGEGVEPSRVRRPARIAAWRLAVRPAGQGKGPGARSTPRSVSGGIVLSVGFPTCSRGDSPFHPFRQERHDRSIILLGGGLVSVRLPGLSAARLATGRVALWSEDVPQRPLWPPSAAHGLLDIYPHVRMEMQPPGVEPGRPTQRVLGPLPYRLGHGCRVRAVGFEPTQGLDPPAPRAGAVVRLATHAMRPAGFEPAITAASERRVSGGS